jgi:hypothetical protein
VSDEAGVVATASPPVNEQPSAYHNRREWNKGDDAGHTHHEYKHGKYAVEKLSENFHEG